MVELVSDFIDQNRERLSNCRFSGNLQTPGGTVNVYTDIESTRIELKSKMANLSGMVPGLRVGELPLGQSASLILLNDRLKTSYYSQGANTAILSGDREDFDDGQATLWSSYWLMEAQRQEKSLFTLHSSVLKIDNKGVVLFGHSGAGKTAVMLDLCRKYNGCVISNDLTVIRHNTISGELEVVDGTKDLRLRLSSVSRNFPDLSKLFHESNLSPWEDKIAVTPEQIGLVSCGNPSKLDAMFEVHLDSKEQDPLLVERAGSIPFLYRLYEDMSRIVKGSAISLFTSDAEFLGYLPSLDNAGNHNRRVDCINQMVKGVGVVSVSGGNLDQISEVIYSRINTA